MPKSAALQLGAVPFAEAIDAATSRGVVLPSVYYGELQGLARSITFSVAGIAKIDQLQQVQDSLAKAVESGSSFDQWRKEILKSPDALALPRHRLDNIFRNNVQGAYARGAWEKIERNKDNRPYLMYSAINDGRTRPHHAAMDGHVAAVDDPIWDRWYPPAGHSCRCGTTTLSESQADRYRDRDAARMEKNPALRQERLNAQPDKGWDYHPGKQPTEGVRRAIDQRLVRCREQGFARKTRGRCLDRIQTILGDLATPLDRGLPLPKPRPTQIQPFPGGLKPEEYADRFIAQFSTRGEASVILRSVHELPLLLSVKMLRKQSGAWKSDKRGRGPYLPFVAEGIKDPDEVWVEEDSRYRLARLYYLASFRRGTEIVRTIAVFQSDDGVFEGVTAYVTPRADHMESKRAKAKMLLYRKTKV